LLVKSLMFGGLNNQLMAFNAYLKLAIETNRTFVIPQFCAECPFVPHTESIVLELDDIFELPTSSDHPMVSFNEIPPIHFLSSSETVYMTGPGWVETEGPALLNSPSFKDESMIVLEHKESKQYMTHTENFDFKLNSKMKSITSDLIGNISGNAHQQEPLRQYQNVVFLHLRIEKDWRRYCNLMTAKPGCYIDLPEIQKRFSSMDKELNQNRDVNQLLILSYASDALMPNTPDLHIGWPAHFKVVTNQDIDKMFPSYLTYLEKSVVMKEIGLQAMMFIGHSLSSFSQNIVQYRWSHGFNRSNSLYYDLYESSAVEASAG